MEIQSLQGQADTAVMMVASVGGQVFSAGRTIVKVNHNICTTFVLGENTILRKYFVALKMKMETVKTTWYFVFRKLIENGHLVIWKGQIQEADDDDIFNSLYKI